MFRHYNFLNFIFFRHNIGIIDEVNFDINARCGSTLAVLIELVEFVVAVLGILADPIAVADKAINAVGFNEDFKIVLAVNARHGCRAVCIFGTALCVTV